MARHKESAAAIAGHVYPESHLDYPHINEFLSSQTMPDNLRGVLDSATPGVWRTAGRMTWGGAKYTTPLSPNKPVKHYDMKSAAMFILKNGVDKVREMPQKIAEARGQTNPPRKPYNPLDIFSDRRNNNGR